MTSIMKFSLKLIGYVLALLIILLTGLAIYYLHWVGEFESRHAAQILYVDDIDKDSFPTEVQSKVDALEESAYKTDALQLTPDEFARLLFFQLLENGYNVRAIYIDAADGEWDVWIKTGYGWFGGTIHKDNIQSAELYLTKLNFGPYHVGWMHLPGHHESLLQEINNTYSETLLRLDVNELTGRRIENIELEEGGMTLKVIIR